MLRGEGEPRRPGWGHKRFCGRYRMSAALLGLETRIFQILAGVGTKVRKTADSEINRAGYEIFILTAKLK
jgi:hypothetical protein